MKRRAEGRSEAAKSRLEKPDKPAMTDRDSTQDLPTMLPSHVRPDVTRDNTEIPPSVGRTSYNKTFRNWLRPLIPAPIRTLRRSVSDLRGRFRETLPLILFEWKPSRATTYLQRHRLAAEMRLVHRTLRCPHRHAEMVAMVEHILSIPRHVEGCIVEAGCFKGGSTAKLSLAAKLCRRQLVVLDSFAGIPDNDEVHGKTLLGEHAEFPKGLYCGQLEEVKENVRRFGAIDVCEFVPGWFEETMPHLKKPIVMAFVDVDLAASTRICLQYLYPLLVPGGVIFSHDGHLPLCIEAIADSRFWAEVVGYPKPEIPGLGKEKLLRISKPM